MKTLMLSILLLLFATSANADVYLIINNKDEVLSAQNTDDAVVEEGQKKFILPGKIEDYDLQYPANFYKLKNKRLVVNTEKITEEESIMEHTRKYREDMVLIQNRIMKDACDALVNEGIKLTVVKCDSFK